MKIVTMKELKQWKDSGEWPDNHDGWRERIFDTFTSMEMLLVVAQWPQVGLHQNVVKDIRELLCLINGEEPSEEER